MMIAITPVVVIPDVSPLIHLAAAGRLILLQEFGRVVVMDIVAYEASRDTTKPWAREVAAWIAKGQEAGSDQPVEVVKTEIGEAYRLARRADPEFRMQNAGENAIRDWLVETLPEVGGPALVVYEDKKMPKLIRRERLEDVVVVATTRALLAFAEERGLIDSAEDVWSEIMKLAAGANPRRDVQVMRPRRGI
jgi:predicted nucleic acid-binding protein